MSSYFYSHLIKIDTIEVELDKIGVSKTEKKDLIFLIHSNIHHSVVDFVLSELDEDDKKEFLKRLNVNAHDKTWVHLREKITNIEKKVEKIGIDLIDEFYRDILDSKEKSKVKRILRKNVL